MKIKKEINLFAGMFTAEEIYRYGDIILLLGHIIYLVLFYRFGVYQMVYYNYFSVAFYAVMYFLLHFKKIGKISFTYLVLGEIIVHACMGAYYIGWSAGFTQIMLCIIPIPFFISQNRKAIPYILSSFDVVVFIVMRIIVTNRVAPYSFDTNRENILYIYNTLCSFIIIIYVSSIYIFTNEHNKREAKAQNEKLQKLATIDPLTQLFNRRAMMDFIKKIESNSRRTNSVYSMCLGDIDDFKHVNDTYGHEVGDKVLRAVSDVIADILTLCGGVHNFDFVPDGIRIYNCADMVVNPQFRISSNTELKNSIKYIGNVEHKTSIDDRKTSVKVISDTDVLTTLKDENSIAQFGFLQEVIKVGENEDAKDVAKNKLSELNTTSETYSGEIIEELNSYTRAGSVIAIGDEKYLINSSQHSIKQGVHYNKLDLERL